MVSDEQQRADDPEASRMPLIISAGHAGER